MSAFRKSFPIVLTSFINKAGQIGLGLLPMLLVGRQVSSGKSAFVMGTVKSVLLVGLFAGGWMTDRLGARFTILVAFLLAAVGLGALPFAPTLPLIALAAIVAQAGESLYQSPARILITQVVDRREQQEAVGWLRGANNLGQIVSYGIGAAFTASGFTLLMLFDSATSVAAAIVGYRLLPGVVARVRESASPPRVGPEGRSWRELMPAGSRRQALVQLTLIIAGYGFLYEVFLAATAARCELVFGQLGLRVFSEVMLINTILCTGFAVLAARRLKRVESVLPLGLALTLLGTLLTTAVPIDPSSGRAIVFAGAFVITAGEIVFTAVAQFSLIRLTQDARRGSSAYSAALVAQALGRVAGSSAAFPLVVSGAHPAAWVGATGLAFFLLALVARPGLRAELGVG